MSETRKLAAILASDVVGYSRLAGADEDRILARLRTLRSDLIDPIVAVHHGRIVKRTGDGAIVEFRSVVDAVRCAIEVQNGMRERNTGVPDDQKIQFRIGIHLGDVVEESDGDLMGDGVNIAARLQSIAQPGAICLSEDAYRQVKARLDLKVNDLGATQLKNIAEPIHVYSLEVGQPGVGQRASAPDKSASPRLSIVVLPFANLGGDPEQDYFVDGVTESLTTDLSRIRGSFVIARNTAFTFRGKPFDVRQIGRELNVRYVLEGSVQRGGNRMRINAQLVDAATGNHIWAERFDKPTADLFDLQDEIVARLANTLQTQLLTAEARRAERAARPDSMDLYFQGMAWFNRGSAPECLLKAVDFFDRALQLDKGNVDALVGVSHANAMLGGTHAAEDWAARYARAEATASQAISLAPDHAAAHMCLGIVQIYTNRAALGISECERALMLDRNLAAAHAYIGMAKFFTGRAEETEAHIEEAFRLSPRDTLAYHWLAIAGAGKVFLGRDEEAVPRFQRSIEANRSLPAAHFYLAVALTRLGRSKEARAALETGLILDPTFSVRRYRDEAPSDNPIFMGMRERIYGAMRKAGVPEG
jgi:TolB-like protein/class 3 adenylate cyclase/Flp pilus assembly protein TadD